MISKLVRLYDKDLMKLDAIELPKIKDDEILAKIVSDSVCMSTYKAVIAGTDHKRIPPDIAEHPVVMGHEFTGIILEVGEKWKDQYKAGDRFVIQPAVKYKGSPYAPGYSYEFCGGAASEVIIPNEVMVMGCLLPYHSDDFFYGSLAEPMSCIIGAFHANYHNAPGKYEHIMGVKPGGKMALLASAGPMGLGAIDYAIHCDRHPELLVVTDIDNARLERAKSIYTPEKAAECGVKLVYVNTAEVEDAEAYMKELAGGTGYDDVFAFAPVKPVLELADSILGDDGCLNFFAGPTNTKFSAEVNYYEVHYSQHHAIGTSGGTVDDMLEAIDMMSKGQIDPASMITHVGGIDAVIDTVNNLPKIPGGKKLIYTNIDMELTAIEDFGKKSGELYEGLHEICQKNNGLWCGEAERFLLKYMGAEIK